MLRIRYKQAYGFTLLELIVVLSIALALLGLGVPRMVSTMGAMEFRRGVVLTVSFLRRSHLDAVVKGDTLRLKLEGNRLTRSDGREFPAPGGLRLSLPLESKDSTLAVFSPSGRNTSQRLYISDKHKRRAVISIDPLSSIPTCRYH